MSRKAPKQGDTEAMLSIAEAAASTGRCVESIYRLVRSRRIEAAKDTDGNWRIPRKALDDYYDGRRAQELST